MVVLDSPFAALQLTGLMLPVVVLTLRAYLDQFETSSNYKGIMQDFREIRYDTLSTFLSLVCFVISALVVLGGLFFRRTPYETYVLPTWAFFVAIAYSAEAILSGLWLRRIWEMGKMDLI
jgi:hypothetical protein